MMCKPRWSSVLAVLFLAAAVQAETAHPALVRLKAEPNLEKRASLCWPAADKALSEADRLHREGKLEESYAQLALMMEIVELGYQSLVDTGKDPRRSSKHFKRAEQAITRLHKRTRALLDAFSFEEREQLEKYPRRLEELRSTLLRGILGLP